MHEPLLIVALGEIGAGLRAARFRAVERTERDRLRDIDQEFRFEQADEIFSSGNFAKLSSISRIDDRELQPGPIYRKASELYRAFAEASPI